MFASRTITSVAIVLVGLFGASGGAPPASMSRRVPDQAPATAAEIQSIVVTGGRNAGDHVSSGDPQQLTSLYAPVGYVPLWTDGAGRLSSGARDALALLKHSGNDGLDPDDYSAERLQIEAARLEAAPVPQVTEVAAFDVSLSLNTLRYLRHLHVGRVDPRAMGYTMPERERDDFAGLLRAAVVGHTLQATASELSPQIPLYRQLRSGLARYRALAADPAVGSFRPPDATLRPGDRSPDVEPLSRFLAALGDLDAPLPEGDDAELYSGRVVEAVRRFQMRHGLDADGVLGKATRAGLAVPLSWRARQIELSLERMRWLPHLDPDRLLVVNIPMFRLRAVDRPGPGGVSSFSSDVIVGRALRTRTPVFLEEMEYVIFRPYWNIPTSIVRNEILPALRRTPSYLQRHDMEIVAGQSDSSPVVPASEANLSRLRDGTLRLRQRPGPENALGLVKFVFPNDANVYLHGTPAPELFTRARRDFSHGCIRVADPVGLAEWVLGTLPGWDRDAILAAMNAPTPQRVVLPRPMQVVVFYLTAAATRDNGDIQFADDIYGHDARLDRFLTRRAAS